MQIIQTLHRVHQMASALFGQECDITTTQAIVLHALKENPGCSQTTVVGMTGIDRSTLADVMRRLKANGLVRRVRSKKDSRAYICELTKEGERALSNATSAAATAEQALLKQVPAIKSLRIAA